MKIEGTDMDRQQYKYIILAQWSKSIDKEKDYYILLCAGVGYRISGQWALARLQLNIATRGLKYYYYAWYSVI